MLVRSCERGCDLRCDEQKVPEWAQKVKEPTKATCIDPAECEKACTDAAPKELEEIMFEERVARTGRGKMTVLETCIRGCTDRKVGYKDRTVSVSDHSFRDVDDSGGTCYNLCETTIRGTLQVKKAVADNDAKRGGGDSTGNKLAEPAAPAAVSEAGKTDSAGASPAGTTKNDR